MEALPETMTLPARALPETQPKLFRWQLTYRPPFDWPGMLRFLGARMLRGVEWVRGAEYLRTARVGEFSGWLHVRNSPGQRTLVIELSQSLAPAASALLPRLGQLFDLSAKPNVIAERLMRGVLAETVARNPGLRVPGAFDGFELAVRAILGQQITVKGATTLAGRFVEAFGEPIETAHPGLTRLSPTAERIALAPVERLTALGIMPPRAESIMALAREMACGRVTLAPCAQPEDVMKQLVALPGIGRWTAEYIAMRALRWPDAFPHGDLAVRNSLGGVTATRAEEIAEAWRPWRSYAALHLWQQRAWNKR
jgi:AraC family transcriptional regulator of adaptative response / DNA-3-methyladenine glycosylase II